MTKQELLEILNSNGLEKLAVKIEPTLRTAIRIKPIECEEDKIKIGQSKFGGQPDLPENIAWVKDFEQNSLAFIAQINLHEVARLDTEDLLPKTGILYFFYDATQSACGLEIADRENNMFKVIYYDGDLDLLQRKDFPDDLPEESEDEYSPNTARFTPAKIKINQEISYPSNGETIYEDLTSEEYDIFAENFFEDDSIHKLLGYSNNLQNPMEIECELITNGIVLDDPDAYETPEAIALKENVGDWRLLLQVDSTEEGEGSMDFAGGGTIYYWIKKQDLLNKDFDKVWFSLQSY
ncbi:MAG: YwqG family protein [Bacteroidota bacterium]